MVTVEDLKLLPEQPGVYLMKNRDGKIIYVGKAISLKSRVRSYFQAARNLSPRIQLMVSQIEKIEFIVAASEYEALVLECNLIKEERPKYNIRLRDDKQYPWVKVAWQQAYPEIYLTRSLKRDGSKYYGPYTNGAAIRETLKLLRQIFPLRSCRRDLEHERIARPCLNFHIKRCLAPCNGGISKVDYREMIQQICLFLEGRQTELREQLQVEMQVAATNFEYERAAQLRDRLRDIEKIMEKQKVVSATEEDLDILGIAQDERGSVVQVFQVRQGKLIGREYFLVNEGNETASGEILEAFLMQYYDQAAFIPGEILLPTELTSMETMAQWLSGQKGSTAHLKQPQRGEKVQLIKMAVENAQILLKQERTREDQEAELVQESLTSLQQELKLPKLPLRIEGFDISNTQGQEAVASMVVFEGGKPNGSEYRRFKIRTVIGPNDFAMMQEALRRRFNKGLAERAESEMEQGKFAKFPDLLLIDGGKGQLSSALAVLTELGLSEIPVIGLAKQEEEIYLPERDEALILERRSSALRLLQRVRDEAHRFAITYHKSLRDKNTVKSVLDDLKGIGPKRKQLLLKHFGSVKKIRAATIEDFLQLPGINEKMAQRIKEQLDDLR